MLERIFGGKEDRDSTLKELNKVIDYLSVAKADCNAALESGDYNRQQKCIKKICELYDEFNRLSINYLQFIALDNDPQTGLDEEENLIKNNRSTETFFAAFSLDVDDVTTQNNLNLEIYKAFFLFDLQKYRRALKSCESILEVDDSKDGIWTLKGQVLFQLGNFDDALDAFDSAIELEWHNVKAWIGKGLTLQAFENYNDALDAYETALEIDENNTLAIEGRDLVLSQLSQVRDESCGPGESLSEDNKSKPTLGLPSPDKESPQISDKVSFDKQPSREKREKRVFKRPFVKKKDDDKPKGFACVAGMLELKEILTRDVIKPLQNPENYKKFNVTIPNGILLYGPPGCGKTFIVEKLAEEVSYNFIKVPPSKIGSKYIHETSDNIAKVFTEAKDNAPTILFFDEFEALVPRRESLGAEGQFKNEEINEFLTHLNNASNHGILVVGATNQVNLIDSAVMRAGRMDKVILVPPPDPEARKELFRSRLSKVPQSDDIDYTKLADLTDCYSSSDITAIIEAAGRIAGDQELDEINMDLMTHVIENQRPSISKSQIKSYEEFSHLERK